MQGKDRQQGKQEQQQLGLGDDDLATGGLPRHRNPEDVFFLGEEKVPRLDAAEQADQALQHQRDTDGGHHHGDVGNVVAAQGCVKGFVQPHGDHRGQRHCHRHHHEAGRQSEGRADIGEHHRQGEGEKSPHGHHVAMREMGKAQDAEHQRHPDRPHRIDRADRRPGDNHLVDKENQFVHFV